MSVTADPVVIVVCGPSGVGKSTIGSLLADRLEITFWEGDTFHSEANVAKMKQGIPLDDNDRAPWLQRIHDEVIMDYCCANRRSAVLACSALKRSYRDVLRGIGEIQCFFVMLTGDAELIADRLSARRGHFMPSSLLSSQMATLEPLDLSAERGMAVNVMHAAEEIVDLVMHHLLTQ